MATKAERNADGTPTLEETEEVIFTERNVYAFFDGPPFTSEGKGDLYVTSRRVVWLNPVLPTSGFGVDFTSLSVHAICSDTTTFPQPCVYCQIDTSDDSLSELRFVPSSLEALSGIYSAFSAGAEMNPDPPGSDDEDMGDFFFNEEEVKTNLAMPQVMEAMSTVTIHTAIAPEANGRFADAEESEDEDEGDGDDEEMSQDGA